MTEATKQHDELRVGHVGRNLRSAKATGIAGLVFAMLFIASLVILRGRPADGSSAAEIAHWYLQTNVRRLELVGLYLAPFSGIAFLWFIAAIRDRIGAREDRFFATVFLGSGLLFVAMLSPALPRWAPRSLRSSSSRRPFQSPTSSSSHEVSGIRSS